MLAKFWEKTAEGIAAEWSARALTPALLFWGVGFYFWSRKLGSWQDLQTKLTTTDSQGLTLIIAALLVLVASMGLMNWFTLPVLKFMEGYWRWPLAGRRYRRSEKNVKQLGEKRAEADQLRARKAALTARESEQLASLENEILLFYPNKPELVMPTRLGNVLRAAEEYPLRYGLEMVSTLPHLWLVLPENVQKELNAARQTLDERARLAAWGLLLLVWCFFAPGLLEAALVVTLAAGMVVISYWFSLGAAEIYGQLLRAAYDLYRFDLYRQLAWPLPETPAGEKAAGKVLHQHLYRFASPTKVRFAHKEESKEEEK